MRDYFNVSRFDIVANGGEKRLVANPMTGAYTYYDEAEKAFLALMDDALVLLARAANRGHFLHKFNCPFYSALLCDKAPKEEAGICAKEKPWSRDSIKVNFSCFLRRRDDYLEKNKVAVKDHLVSGACGFCNFEGCFQCDNGDHFILSRQYEEQLGKKFRVAMTQEEVTSCLAAIDELPNYRDASVTDEIIKDHVARVQAKIEGKTIKATECDGCNTEHCLQCENYDHYEAASTVKLHASEEPTKATEPWGCNGDHKTVKKEEPAQAYQPEPTVVPEDCQSHASYALGDAAHEALRIVCQDRQDQYGSPEDSFATIAAFWSSFLGVEITPYQAGVMMILLKLARVKGQAYHRDNFVDVIGYAILCADRLAKQGSK